MTEQDEEDKQQEHDHAGKDDTAGDLTDRPAGLSCNHRCGRDRGT
jgi:hypothetical protein